MEERLQKYMARCGVASRRKCEEIILAGKVKVNGMIINELGTKVTLDDIVEYEGKRILPEENKVYIMLNKPEGVITSAKDEKGRKTILDIVKVEERVYPIGRLDYDSSGLLLLTNDGDVYNNIIHPRVEIDKKYIAECKGIFSKQDIEKFEKGLDIGGYVTAPAKIRIISEDLVKNSYISTVEMTIHEGKNRQIRRMCEAVGRKVLALHRSKIGTIGVKDLELGKWRYLREDEVKKLIK